MNSLWTAGRLVISLSLAVILLVKSVFLLLKERTAAFDVHIQMLEKVSDSRINIVSVGERLDALGEVSNPPIPALGPAE